MGDMRPPRGYYVLDSMKYFALAKETQDDQDDAEKQPETTDGEENEAPQLTRATSHVKMGRDRPDYTTPAKRMFTAFVSRFTFLFCFMDHPRGDCGESPLTNF